MASAVQDIVEKIKGFTALELKELGDALEEEFGVVAAAPVAVAGMAAPGAGAAAEEKSEFDVVLKDFSDKIKTIKVVRDITTLDLVSAKKLVEEKGKTVKEGVSKDEAEEIKKKFEEIGATVEIK